MIHYNLTKEISFVQSLTHGKEGKNSIASNIFYCFFLFDIFSWNVWMRSVIVTIHGIKYRFFFNAFIIWTLKRDLWASHLQAHYFWSNLIESIECNMRFGFTLLPLQRRLRVWVCLVKVRSEEVEKWESGNSSLWNLRIG